MHWVPYASHPSPLSEIEEKKILGNFPAFCSSWKVIKKEESKMNYSVYEPYLEKVKNVLQESTHWMHDPKNLEVWWPKWQGSSRWARSVRMDTGFIKCMPFLYPVRINVFSMINLLML